MRNQSVPRANKALSKDSKYLPTLLEGPHWSSFQSVWLGSFLMGMIENEEDNPVI